MEMATRTYARIQDGLVAEILATDGDILGMFHPSLLWLDVTSQPDVSTGWSFDGTYFARPDVAQALSPPPTIADLQAQIAMLSAQVAALPKKSS